VYQMDVKGVFLHGELDEDMYVEQPFGYKRKGEEYKVFKSKKALYGLKQTPKAWFSTIESNFLRKGMFDVQVGILYLSKLKEKKRFWW